MKKRNILSIAVPVIVSTLFVVVVVYAATTIGTNISADGTITAVGQLRASSTALFTGDVTTYGNVTFGNEATDVNLFTGMLQASTTALFTGATTFYSDFVLANTATSTVTMTNGLNFDSNTFVIDPNSGYVGVGTDAPSDKLHIDGDIRIKDNGNIYADGIGDLRIGNTNGGIFFVGGDSAISIMSAVSNSLKHSWSRDADTNTETIYFTGSNTAGEVEYFRVQGHSNSNDMETVFNDGSQVADFRIEADTDTHSFFLNGSTGNIGVGTSTPTVNFQVTEDSVNATTTMEIGKTGQNKGTCLKMYDATGTLQYVSIEDGSFVISATSCE